VTRSLTVGTMTGNAHIHADEWQGLPDTLNEAVVETCKAAAAENFGSRIVSVSHDIVAIPTGYLLTVVVTTERENP
jgi:hypothetical protein